MPGILKFMGPFIKPSNRLYWRVLLLLVVLSSIILLRNWVQNEGCHYLPDQMARSAMLNQINTSGYMKDKCIDQGVKKIGPENMGVSGNLSWHSGLNNIHICRWVKLNNRMRVYQLEARIKNKVNQPAIKVAGNIFLRRSGWTWQIESMVIQPIKEEPSPHSIILSK